MQNLKAASTRVKLVTLAIAIVAIAAPVLFAINQSWRHGQNEEMKKVLAYANDVQNRTDSTADQIDQAIKRLQDAHLADPCSDESLTIMSNIDLSSSYIQAIGHVSNGIFECSSMGRRGQGWDLGPIDFVSSRGVAFRTHVSTPFAPDTVFTVVERDGYAAIINKSLPVDTTTAEKDASLAAFSLDNDKILAARGMIKPDWVQKLGDQSQVVFFSDNYVVAIVKSSKYRTGALAALPTNYIDKQTRSLAMVLVPIGLVSGFLFAFAAVNLARIQISMPAMLRSAIKQNEFFMLYQPVVDLQNGKWVGAEALMRWRRSSGEMIPPDIFIQVAEEVGLIQRITERTIKLVGQDVAGLFKKHPGFHLGINLSSADLRSEQTLELLGNLIRETGAGPENLIVEATERGFMETDIVRQIIEKIRASGIKIAIDDFGTGYSSLSYLESFEIDYLKIDKSFVDKIGTDAPTSHVVLHIIELAKELNMRMIAEGVETEAQAEFLRGHGVQYAQGWLYGKPMTLSDIFRKLSSAS